MLQGWFDAWSSKHPKAKVRSHQYRPNYRIIIISHCHHSTILFHHSPASSSVHNGLASLLTKERGESALVMSVEVILDKRLTTKLVHTLSDLVSSSKTKTREKGSIFLHEGFVGSILIHSSSVPCWPTQTTPVLFLKVPLPWKQSCSRQLGFQQRSYHHRKPIMIWRWAACLPFLIIITTYSGLVAHKTLGNGINRMENEKFQDTRAGTTEETSGSWFRLSSGDGRRHDK